MKKLGLGLIYRDDGTRRRRRFDKGKGDTGKGSPEQVCSNSYSELRDPEAASQKHARTQTETHHASKHEQNAEESRQPLVEWQADGWAEPR